MVNRTLISFHFIANCHQKEQRQKNLIRPCTYSTQTREEWNAKRVQPFIALNEIRNCELACLSGVGDDPITRPRNSATRICTGTSIVVLSIIQSIQCKGAIPFQPPCRVYQILHQRIEINSPGILLPGTTQVVLELRFDRDQISSCCNLAVDDGNAGVLVRVFSTLCGEEVPLVWIRFACVQVAVLEHHCCITKDEVYGSINVAFAVELTQRVDIERVLVGYKAALVEG